MKLSTKAGEAERMAWRGVQGDPPHLENPPGQSDLSYRIGTYGSWVEIMVHALMDWDHFPLTTPPTEVSDEASFMSPRFLSLSQRLRIRLNLSREDNWILGLVHAWATVGDVLTFYQERLLHEGYLRTARRRFSVHELARLLDYRPRPAVGGSVELAWSATDVEGLPPRVTLDAGTAIASVPPPGTDPQNFETETPLVARAEWNLLRPERVEQQVPPVVRGEDLGVELAGAEPTLGPGSGLLIRGRWPDGGEAASFRLLSTAEIIRGEPPRTAVSWRESLDGQRPELELLDPEILVLSQESRLFGHAAPAWEALELAVQRKVRAIEGGVRVLSRKGWRSLNESLPAATVRCLAWDRDGNLFAGTEAEGAAGSLLCRPAGGAEWRAGEAPPQLDVRSLAVDPDGGMLAGTGAGAVYRSTDRGQIWAELTGRSLGRARWTLVRRQRRLDRLPAVPVRALLTIAGNEPWTLLAGTDLGIFASDDLSNSWLPVNAGFPGLDDKTGETSLVITALARASAGGEIFAATASGVFKCSRLGRGWKAVNRGLPGVDPATGLCRDAVPALTCHEDRRRRTLTLFAATAQGVYRSSDGGVRWQPVRQGMRTRDGKGLPRITTLAISADAATVTTRLFAGAADGLWLSEDLGDSWTRVELGSPEVTALAAGPRAELAVAGPFHGFAEEEWPHFHLSHGEIDLDRVIPGIAAGGWVALVPDADVVDAPPVSLHRVQEVAIVERRDFDLAATVTRLVVAPDPVLHRYDLRTARAFFASRPLLLSPRTRPAAPVVALGEALRRLAEMDAERPVIARAARIAGTIVPELPAAVSPPRPEDLEYGLPMAAGELEAALAGIRGRSVELPEALTTAAADPFEALRTTPVDALSLAVHGNVAVATEGRTVREEVLGDGRSDEILQRFPLQHPLAYLRGAPLRSTLEVRVQGQPWREIPRLLDAEEDERVYEVELDHLGFATVVFGDGVHGARLPSGHGNVVATYRTGTSDRDILPGSVRLMTSRPLGLASVGNPLPGTPGAAAESPDAIRRASPRSILTFDRIVSLRDYENFAGNFPGIVKATVAALPLAGRRAVHLTVATHGEGHRPGPSSRLLGKLLEAIEEIRCHREPVHAAAFQRAELEIEARVRVEDTYFWDEVKPRLDAALRERFGFERSRFGESLKASEAIHVLQSCAGVRAVDLEVFRRLGDDDPAEPVRQRVDARPAFWDPAAGEIVPAELVWLDRPVLHERTGAAGGSTSPGSGAA